MRLINVLIKLHKDNFNIKHFDKWTFYHSDFKSDFMCNLLNFSSHVQKMLLHYFLPHNYYKTYKIHSNMILFLDKYYCILDIHLVSLFLYLRFRKGLKAPELHWLSLHTRKPEKSRNTKPG